MIEVDDDKYVTRAEAAALLQEAGQAVTAEMVRKWQRDGHLEPVASAAGRVLYSMRAVWRAEAAVRTRAVRRGRPRRVG